MKRFVPFALALVLVGLLVVFNKRFNNGTVPDPDEAPPPPAAQKAAAPPPPNGSTTPADALPSDAVLGNPQTAKYHVTFGYAYDPATQANPQQLAQIYNAVRAAQAGRPDVSAVIADVDVPDADRLPGARGLETEGVSVNGKPVTNPVNLATALKP